MRSHRTTPPSTSARTVVSRAGRLVTPAFVAAAVVILAACGSSGSSAKSSSSTKATSSTTGAPSAVVVKTASNPQLGTILVDSDGKTLYTLTNGSTAVACTGACLTVWPPLLLPAGTTTATGSDVSGLATVAATGGEQVTHDGLPLYHFAPDMAAGSAGGEGISSFGGVWHVVKVSGSAASGGTGSDSSSSTTSTTKKSSSGY